MREGGRGGWTALDTRPAPGVPTGGTSQETQVTGAIRQGDHVQIRAGCRDATAQGPPMGEDQGSQGTHSTNSTTATNSTGTVTATATAKDGATPTKNNSALRGHYAR